MKFRKKTVVIEAKHFLSYTEGIGPQSWNNYKGGEIYQWLIDNKVTFHMDQKDPGPAYLVITTLEGEMKADVGDWIIKGVKGEFYPCKPDIFEMTYEKVED